MIDDATGALATVLHGLRDDLNAQAQQLVGIDAALSDHAVRLDALEANGETPPPPPPTNGSTDAMRSVKDFGAVGDGVADDTAAIQAAMDAGPGHVYAPPGVYLQTESLLFRPGVTVVGEYGATVFRAAPQSNISGLFVSQGQIPMFGLRNVILHGDRARQAWNESVGLRLAHGNTGGGYRQGASREALDAYGVFENVFIEGIAGTGIRGTGAACLFRGVTVLGCNGKGIETGINDAEWVNCTVGGCAEEGWLCYSGSGRYYGCKAFFCGHGGAEDGSFGNYNLGVGFRVTNGNQMFSGCEGQDIDGPAFRIQGRSVFLSGCWSSQGSNLQGTSRSIGQEPIRGGGWAGVRCGFEIWHADGVVISGGGVRDRLIDADSENAPNLDCAVHIENSSDALVTVGGDRRALASGRPWIDGGTGAGVEL